MRHSPQEVRLTCIARAVGDRRCGPSIPVPPSIYHSAHKDERGRRRATGNMLVVFLRTCDVQPDSGGGTVAHSISTYSWRTDDASTIVKWHSDVRVSLAPLGSTLTPPRMMQDSFSIRRVAKRLGREMLHEGPLRIPYVFGRVCCRMKHRMPQTHQLHVAPPTLHRCYVVDSFTRSRKIPRVGPIIGD